MNEMYSTLKNVVTPVTPKVEVTVSKENGATFVDGSLFLDADDELLEIAKYIKLNASHNEDIVPERIKYLYTTQSKKDGGKYVLGQLEARKSSEKMISNEFDYILSVHYNVWAELDIEHKVIQLDKLLCGVKITDGKNVQKNAVDTKEFISNLRHYGTEKSLKSTEIVDLTANRIIEEEKEAKKTQKLDKAVTEA